MFSQRACRLFSRSAWVACLGGASLLAAANTAAAGETIEITMMPRATETALAPVAGPVNLVPVAAQPMSVPGPTPKPALSSALAPPVPEARGTIVRAQDLGEPRPLPPDTAPDKPSRVSQPTLQYSGPVLAIDLPTALRLVNASNPTIALARARAEEAYARLREARTLWLPNLETGPAYNHHDGNLQNARGEIFRVTKSNFFEGGGAALRVESGNALFGPLVARRLVEAQDAASRTVTEEVQLDVAITYLDLLRAYGALAVNADSLVRAQELARSADAAIKNSKSKSGADLNQAQAEVEIRKEERINLEGEAAAVSARLAQLLLLEPTVNLRPLDPAVVPISVVPDEVPLDELVATGFMNRPELAESRALVAAALARWRQSRLSPLLPRVEASYYAGTFAGGLNDTVANFSSRGDGTAQVVWELQGLGAGYLARTQVQRSLYNQASIHVTEIQARVGAEVTAAAKLAYARRRALENAQRAVTETLDVWRKLREASFGMVGAGGRFDPVEGLFAEQNLNRAREQYLTQVIEYNKAQFRLYRAMGQPPLAALPRAAARKVNVEVAPGGVGAGEALQYPRAGGPTH